LYLAKDENRSRRDVMLRCGACGNWFCFRLLFAFGFQSCCAVVLVAIGFAFGFVSAFNHAALWCLGQLVLLSALFCFRLSIMLRHDASGN